MTKVANMGSVPPRDRPDEIEITGEMIAAPHGLAVSMADYSEDIERAYSEIFARMLFASPYFSEIKSIRLGEQVWDRQWGTDGVQL